MDAAQSLHPTGQTLSSFARGRLDDRSAEAVNEHLMECSDCRKRVAEMSADSFLNKDRDTQKPSDKSAPGPSDAGIMPGDQRGNTSKSSSADSIPPELATHPDYEIKKELGWGGMGVVYLAHNTLMKRDEVLKVMGQHLMERSGALERFLREIQSVARLRHPNIVTAHHATRLGQNIVFAMEYVEGLDLSRLVKAKGPLQIAHACLFTHQVALGLQHAHEEGLVHRDIKPHNLMLARRGDKATVKILDFGLAKAAREEKLDGGLTAQGQALGTPDYIAPEQILDAQSADIRADIYSLGATLYYLLTGRPPFHAKSLYDLYQAHISRNADPLNLVRPEVPSELAALVAKMMAKDPTKRFQTPGEVAEALKPFCTISNAALKIVKTEVSQGDQGKSAGSVAEAAFAAIEAETDADQRIVRARKSSESSASESRWDSMIDFRDAEASQEEAPGLASRRSAWVWPSVVVGVFMLGLFAAWMGGVFKVKTPRGVIVLENLPKDSEVLFDGNKITFAWPNGGKPLEIQAVPGQHRVEVSKEGFRTFGQVVTVKTDDSEELTVRLEPLAVVGPEPKKPEVPELKEGSVPEPKPEIVATPTKHDGVSASGFVSLFNGKDLSGWKTHSLQPGNWRVEDGILIGSGPGVSHLYTDRGDYGNFHLRLETRLNNGGDSGVYFRAPFGPRYPTNKPQSLSAYNAKIDKNRFGGLIVEDGSGRPAVRDQTLMFEPDHWITLDIIIQVYHIEIKINGVKTTDYMDQERHYPRGHIALQQHGPKTVAEFRKIEIKDLNGIAPSTASGAESLPIQGPVDKPPVASSHEPSVPLASDSLQPGSVWLTDKGDPFTILERHGEWFKARFVGAGIVIREVSGTIKDGRLRWLARDVKALRGGQGGDNWGEIKGDTVAMSWSDPGGPIRGQYTLRLVKRAPGNAP